MGILVLDATTKSIVVAMSAPAATNNPDFTAAYGDSTGALFTEGANDGALNGTSPVTLVAAPAAATRRIIKSITIENKDTANVTVTVSYDNNGTLRTIAKVTLAVGDTWTTDGTFDTYGSIKQTVGVINLTTQVTGVLPIANGGTGQSTWTAGDLPYYATGTALSKLTIGANNTILTSTGSAPQWVTSLTGLTGVSSSGFTNTSLTSGRLMYSTTGGAQTDSANLTFSSNILDLKGTLRLSGSTSGYVGLSPAAAAGSTTYTLPSADGTSGFVLSTNGSGTLSWAPAGGLPTMNIVTGTTQTATAGNQYVLTNAAATTVTLPASPAAGDTVYVTVANGLVTNVVARNGKNIQGLAEDLTLNAQYASVQLRFTDNTEGWVLT